METEKVRIAYKVFEKDMSSYMSGLGIFKIKYKKGKWNKAKIGGLFCFKKLRNAQAISDNGYFPVYRVAVKNIIIKRKRLDCSCLSMISTFWKSNVPKDFKSPILKNTIIVKQVKLLERIN